MRVAAYRGLGIALLALGTAVPASAQDERRAEVSVGYQMLTLKEDDESETLGRGWYADVAANVGPIFAVVVQVGGNYKTFEESQTFGGVTATVTADLTLHQFLGGLRVGPRGTTIEPYVEVLAGGVRGSADVSSTVTGLGQALSESSSESSTEFGLQLGGGVTIWLRNGLGLRGALAYMRVFGDGGGVNVVRAAAGLSFGF
jgi:hypothetical protein